MHNAMQECKNIPHIWKNDLQVLYFLQDAFQKFLQSVLLGICDLGISHTAQCKQTIKIIVAYLSCSCKLAQQLTQVDLSLWNKVSSTQCAAIFGN